MKINDLVKRAGQASIDKGFREKHVDFGTRLMLTVSELSEALEADRKKRMADLQEFEEAISNSQFDRFTEDEFNEIWNSLFERHIKDTVQDELADAVIRIADMCQYYGFDLERHIMLKMEYNSYRPRKHGKEY